jgi:hypothetical protein
MAEPEQIFSSQCHTEQADRYSANRKPFFFIVTYITTQPTSSSTDR